MSKEKFGEIIEAAKLVLSRCDGAHKRDEEGYDIFDAGLFRGFLWYPDIFGFEGLTPEEAEFMRRKLLRYKKQLEELGFTHKILDEPFHDACFFAHGKDWEGRWLRVSPHSLQKAVGGGVVLDLKRTEKAGGWCRIYIKFYRGQPLKEIWIRFNDLTIDGKTKKEWEEYPIKSGGGLGG